MRNSKSLRFDDALPLVGLRLCQGGFKDHLSDGRLAVLRDVTGVLTVIVRDKTTLEKRSDIDSLLSGLSPYVDQVSVVTAAEMFDEALQNDVGALSETFVLETFGAVPITVFDRRLIGADWLESPKLAIEGAPPVAVFWSIKGGVGRSTALCVSACKLAKAGLEVLVIDLDLEAPGIGQMLLKVDGRPKYGALDYFVEENLANVDNILISSMIAPSFLTSARGGSIDVVPAVGVSTDNNPQNMLAKLARAYIDTSSVDSSMSFLGKVRKLIDLLRRRRKYDVILVDARAGLNESAAASILGLGALVLLFGINTPQTFADYRYAFAHLNKLIKPGDALWRSQLQMVHAKASVSDTSRPIKKRDQPILGLPFADRSFDLFAEFLYEEAPAADTEAYNFDLNDPSAPHNPWIIYDDSNFSEFDPIANMWQLDADATEATFGRFSDLLIHRLLLVERHRGGK